MAYFFGPPCTSARRRGISGPTFGCSMVWIQLLIFNDLIRCPHNWNSTEIKLKLNGVLLQPSHTLEIIQSAPLISTPDISTLRLYAWYLFSPDWNQWNAMGTNSGYKH